MRLLAWNVNHRASQRDIPAWIPRVIGLASVDLLVLTEYVIGRDHRRFVASLAAIGLDNVLTSAFVQRENQVLIAAREPMRMGNLVAPSIHPSVPPNALHVVLQDSDLNVLGFRMPAFVKKGSRALKRETWGWVLEAAEALQQKRALIAGDFNTSPKDPVALCGDRITQLTQTGWTHARPAFGCSFRHTSGSEREIDHAFLSGALKVKASEYSWAFQKQVRHAKYSKVGVADHAMLVVEFSEDTAEQSAPADRHPATRAAGG